MDLRNFQFSIHHDDSFILHSAGADIEPDRLKNEDDFVQGMFKFMHDNGGIGLAAHQIGVQYNFFILDIPSEETGIYINPKIIEVSERQRPFKEGCLSYPGLLLTLRRPEEIVVEYYNVEGKPLQSRLKGLAATAFQHEFDHIKGTVFTDLVSADKLKKAKSKIKQNLKRREKMLSR